jgi:hypothetical protein
MPSKEHRRSAVKKAAIFRPRSFETLARSISRMDVDYYFELPEHPDWMRTLNQDADGNPVEVEVNRRLDLATKTRAQMRRVLAFQHDFAGLLPTEAGQAWLELTRVMLSAQIAENVMHFNVGVDFGRDMTTVAQAIERAGIDLGRLPETRLFALAYEIGVIARALAGAQTPGGRGKGGAPGKS